MRPSTDVLADVLDRLDDAPVGIPLQLAHLLGEVGEPHGDALLALARRQRHLAGDGPQQGRLAGAVDADDADPRRPGARCQVIRSSSSRSPRDTDASTRSTTSLPSRVVANAHQLDVVARRRLVGDEGVGRVDAELRLGGAGRRAAAQPGELLAEQVVAALGGDRAPSARARPWPGRMPRSRPRTR